MKSQIRGVGAVRQKINWEWNGMQMEYSLLGERYLENGIKMEWEWYGDLI